MDFKVSRNTMMFLLLQYSINILVPLLIVSILKINTYMSVTEEFVGLSIGIIGIIFTMAITFITKSYLISAMIYLVIKYVYIFLVFVGLKSLFDVRRKRIIATMVNFILTIWAAIVGMLLIAMLSQ